MWTRSWIGPPRSGTCSARADRAADRPAPAAPSAHDRPAAQRGRPLRGAPLRVVTGSSISVQRLSRWWGATRAVDDVSFEAAAGKMLVLLGPSGCGKSTTLRLIAGLEAVTSGRVFIGGGAVTGRPPAERRLSMVFQSYALFPHLSVAENIVFGLRVRRVGAAEREKRPNRGAELLRVRRRGRAALLARKAARLPGGQHQRVALGRALSAETRVCLMDEPLSNLDAQ